MRLEPVSPSVTSGTDIVLQVMVDDVTNMAAYEFEIHYFDSTLDFVSATNSALLGSSGRTVTCLPPQLDIGKVRFGCLTTGSGSTSGVNGSGTLATVTFSTSCTGPSPLDMAVAGFSEPLGDSIPTRAQGGNATVTGGTETCPTPTPTFTPSSTATRTRTPSRTPTRTPTSSGMAGDANCDRRVDAIDAAVELQYSAGLLNALPCRQNADVNDDGVANALDAALILQFVAGLLDEL
jgi:hypothetical protein